MQELKITECGYLKKYSVLIITKLSESELDDLMKIGRFPNPFRNSNKNNVRWSMQEVFEWIDDPEHYEMSGHPRIKDARSKPANKFGIGMCYRRYPRF